MKIIKSTPSKEVSSIYGNFEFVPDEGYELRTYIDYESKLIVVEESPIKKPAGIPYMPEQYIVDPQKAIVLSHEDYKQHFNYELREFYSEDGKYKLESQRKHNPETDRDYEEEKLIDLETGKLISNSKSFVFDAKKRKNALDWHYMRLESKRIEAAKIAARKTLEEHYKLCKQQLTDGKFILGYYKDKQAFKLVYSNGIFTLFEGQTKPQQRIQETNFDVSTQFETLEEFWRNFTQNPKWYLDYQPFIDGDEWRKDRIIASFVINAANEIRKSGNFTQAEYNKLNSWENQVYTETIRRNEYQQYCSNCKTPIFFSARYPKMICRNCIPLLSDKNGQKVGYYNTGFGGYGCQGYYRDGDPKEKYDSNTAYIGDKEFYAQEARFGGIVIQKKN